MPSWWHGWSPDGARLAYVGVRGAGGRCSLYTCALDGSDERLRGATGFDHADGPDYTPDGAWIWFNGERDGPVDLWRVRPDGTDLERMTEGDTRGLVPAPLAGRAARRSTSPTRRGPRGIPATSTWSCG